MVIVYVQGGIFFMFIVCYNGRVYLFNGYYLFIYKYYIYV